ncbi:hypothetical protein D5R40_34310 [Okeania hirsuta]|uniref:Probable multidrug resistance protein NorM n=2 Tax=Okeania hirsuta TaxID=1458930 RepID=A0A3N6NHN1_9CYAN|nr:hypothetical protein D5R40_34310 [Okeania hirsuta]
MTALSLITSVILSILGIIFAPQLIGFLGGTGEILTLGVIYYRIMMIGAFFRIFAVAANTLIRAEGKIKEAMVFSIIAAVLNIILNPIFIYYLDGGIAGAAWATVVAMIIFTLMGIWYFWAGKANYPVSLRTYSLSRDLLKPILSVGVSAMMLQLMFFVQQVIVFRLLAQYETIGILHSWVAHTSIAPDFVPELWFAQLATGGGNQFWRKQYDRVRSSFTSF